ncbi:MAG: hypothetical protein V4584_09540 [Verrucomicrobiota bacterium]
MNPPSILIVTGYEKLSAYLVMPDGLPEIVENIDYQNDGQTSAPLVDWSDGGRCHRAVADSISTILTRYQPETWALACPPELCRKITCWLTPDQKANLGSVRQIDVGNVDVSNVCNVFGSATGDSTHGKEHC